MDDLIERGIFGHRSHLQGHHIVDLAPSRLHVLGRKATRTHQKFDPTRPLALGPSFGPAQQIALGHDADQGAACVDDRQAAELALKHQPDGVFDRSIGGNANRIRCHDIGGPHGEFSCLDAFRGARVLLL
jgi:hypothetical protein